MFIPLSHAAGEAQRNLGEAIVVISDVEFDGPLFVMRTISRSH
jgi:hypothetical protein